MILASSAAENFPFWMLICSSVKWSVKQTKAVFNMEWLGNILGNQNTKKNSIFFFKISLIKKKINNVDTLKVADSKDNSKQTTSWPHTAI